MESKNIKNIIVVDDDRSIRVVISGINKSWL